MSPPSLLHFCVNEISKHENGELQWTSVIPTKLLMRLCSYVQVHRLDAVTFASELLFESPYLNGVNIYYDEIFIRDAFVAVKTFDRSKDGIIIMNWRDKSYYRMQGPVRTHHYSLADIILNALSTETVNPAGVHYDKGKYVFRLS